MGDVEREGIGSIESERKAELTVAVVLVASVNRVGIGKAVGGAMVPYQSIVGPLMVPPVMVMLAAAVPPVTVGPLPSEKLSVPPLMTMF